MDMPDIEVTSGAPPSDSSPAAMKLSELLTATTKLGDWVNTIWAVHSTVSLALLGWWIVKPPALEPMALTLLTVVYAFLMAVNLYSQIRAHRWLDAFVVELQAVAAKTRFQTEALPRAIARLHPSHYGMLYLWHLLVDVFVLLVIWTR